MLEVVLVKIRGYKLQPIFSVYVTRKSVFERLID